MRIKTSELFAAVYNDIYKDILEHKHERYTFNGGRASCKSSFISLMIVLLIVLHPTYNAVIVRRYSKSLRKSVFNQIVWAIDKLGLRQKNGKGRGFKIPKSKTIALPITYIRADGREQVIDFVGLDDPEKAKSIKAEQGYFAILWAEEKTEVDAENLQNFIISALRGGDCFYTFESFNPPSAVRHWCSAELKEYDPHRRICFTTYKDIPRAWLGVNIIHDIIKTKRNNLRAYQNIYEGKATGTGRTIFENVELRPITEEERKAWESTEQGVDWGYYPDPFAYGSMHYDYNTCTLYIWSELYLWKHGNYEAFEKTRDFMQAQGMSIFDDRIIADSAEPKSVGDWRNWGADCRGAVKGKGSRDAGYKWLQTLNKIIIDPITCPHAADEFTLYEYEIDKRTGEILEGYPEGQPDHFIALTRYATEHIWKKSGA